MASNDDIKVYQDKKAKADDFKSSAYTLFIVGVIGIIALIMMELGVFGFRMAAPGKYITYLVMGALFVVFIVMGISSFFSAKKYAAEAVTEDDLTVKIKEWARENIDGEAIKEKAFFEDGTPEEMKYFKYFGVLKESIRQEFGNLNASYLESICEELYSEFFEE